MKYFKFRQTAFALSAAALSGTALATPQLNAGLSLQGWQSTGDVSVQSGTVLGANLGSTEAFVLGTASANLEDDALAAAGAYNLSGRARWTLARLVASNRP